MQIVRWNGKQAGDERKEAKEHAEYGCSGMDKEIGWH
mgnify:CR=1 FL=1